MTPDEVHALGFDELERLHAQMDTIMRTLGITAGTVGERMQALAYEKEALGFHVSGHPLDQYKDEIATFCSGSVERVAQMPQDASVVVGGMLTRVRAVVAKTGKSAGQRMAMFTIADQANAIEGVLFAGTFATYGELMQQDRVVVMIARLDHSRGSPQLVVDRVLPMSRIAEGHHLLEARGAFGKIVLEQDLA